MLWGASNVAKVFESEELAVVWERVVFDHANYIMKSVFDRKKTVTSFFHDAGGGVLGDVVVLGESRKIAKHLNIPIEDHHNLGIIPVLFMPNVPNKNLMGDRRENDILMLHQVGMVYSFCNNMLTRF